MCGSKVNSFGTITTPRDKLFLVIDGAIDMYYRDEHSEERVERFGPQEFVIVPHGIEHRTKNGRQYGNRRERADRRSAADLAAPVSARSKPREIRALL